MPIEYFDPRNPPGLGSWLSEVKNAVTGYIAGKGNIPGDKASRSGKGPSQEEVSAQVAAILAQQGSQPVLSSPTSVDAVQMNKVLLIAGAGVVLYLLTSKQK